MHRANCIRGCTIKISLSSLIFSGGLSIGHIFLHMNYAAVCFVKYFFGRKSTYSSHCTHKFSHALLLFQGKFVLCFVLCVSQCTMIPFILMMLCDFLMFIHQTEWTDAIFNKIFAYTKYTQEKLKSGQNFHKIIIIRLHATRILMTSEKDFI